MLKIKDNVDLKELEKFGFTYEHLVNSYQKIVFSNYVDEPDAEYWIEIDTRKILLNTSMLNDYNLDNTLYDLIQAGLVEKI